MSRFGDEVLWQARLNFGAFHSGYHPQLRVTGVRRVHGKVPRRSKRLLFRFFAKLTILCTRLCKQSTDNLSKLRRKCESVMHVLDVYGAEISYRGLFFRPEDYKTDKQQWLTLGARRLLQQDSTTRTESDINLLLVALRNMSAFAELPKKLQRRLCQIGRYESYEAKRVVQREGDPSVCFYFILSGTVLVTSNDEKIGSRRALLTLTKGMSFGELAVVLNTQCSATVFSKTEVELLAISGSEFREILNAGSKDTAISEKQSQFLRGVTFLRHWPIEKLRTNTQDITVYYFQRSQVLVRDSNNSDWIYIVLKGSLSVIKKLKRVEPTISQKKDRKKLNSRRFKSRHRGLCKSYDPSSLNSNSLLTPPSPGPSVDSPVTFKSALGVEKRLEQTLPGYRNHSERFGCLDYTKIINSYYSKLLGRVVDFGDRHDAVDHSSKGSDNDRSVSPHKDMGDNTAVSPHKDMRDNTATGSNPAREVHRPTKSSFLPDVSYSNKVTGRDLHGPGSNKRFNNQNGDIHGHEETREEQEEPSSGQLSNGNDGRRNCRNINKTSKGVYLSPGKCERGGKVALNSPDLEPQTSDEKRSKMSHEKMDKDDSLNGKLVELELQLQQRVRSRKKGSTVAEELDQKARRDFRITEADTDPVVVELQVLERGQYFGVTPLLFPGQPSLSVLSNGAECLVLSKKLFLQWASEKCLRYLRQTECPYPSDAELAQKLQKTVNWQEFRTATYREVAERIMLKKTRRKQFVPAYQGQYCFRTGPT